MYGPMDYIRNKPLFDRLSRPGIEPISAYYKLRSTECEDRQFADDLATTGLAMAVVSSAFTMFGSSLALPAAMSVFVIGALMVVMSYTANHDELNRLIFENENAGALYDELHGDWWD